MDYIYRIIHIENLPHILSFGITHQSSTNANPNYIAIGNTSIIDKRHATEVTTVDGEIFNPGDYIPFYFYFRMPMLYCIRHGYNVKRVNQENIIYLVIRIDSIVNEPGRRYFFSNAHAVWRRAEFYGARHIPAIDSILDLKAIGNNDWAADYIIRERKQAEFFVSGDIPIDYLHAILCYNEYAQKRVLDMGAKCPVHIYPQAYY